MEIFDDIKKGKSCNRMKDQGDGLCEFRAKIHDNQTCGIW